MTANIKISRSYFIEILRYFDFPDFWCLYDFANFSNKTGMYKRESEREREEKIPHISHIPTISLLGEYKVPR